MIPEMKRTRKVIRGILQEVQKDRDKMIALQRKEVAREISVAAILFLEGITRELVPTGRDGDSIRLLVYHALMGVITVKGRYVHMKIPEDVRQAIAGLDADTALEDVADECVDCSGCDGECRFSGGKLPI